MTRCQAFRRTKNAVIYKSVFFGEHCFKNLVPQQENSHLIVNRIFFAFIRQSKMIHLLLSKLKWLCAARNTLFFQSEMFCFYRAASDFNGKISVTRLKPKMTSAKYYNLIKRRRDHFHMCCQASGQTGGGELGVWRTVSLSYNQPTLNSIGLKVGNF